MALDPLIPTLNFYLQMFLGVQITKLPIRQQSRIQPPKKPATAPSKELLDAVAQAASCVKSAWNAKCIFLLTHLLAGLS